MTINIKSPHEYLNATVVGTPTIIDGVVSGFSDSNYLLTPSVPDSVSNFEMLFKVNPSDITTNSMYAVVGQQTTNRYTPQLAIDGQLFWFGVSVDGSTWTSVSGGTPEVGKDYWLKATWDGSQIELQVSEDGSEYTSLGTTAVSAVTWSELLRIGDDASTPDCFYGSIDLNESYIKINGEYWWKGMELDQYKEISRLYRYDKPRYFKDIYEDWTQPILTANGTLGGDNFACAESAFYTETAGTQQKAWRMFSDDDSLDYRWQVNNVSTSSTYSATWYNPTPIKITAIQVQNATGSYSPAKVVLQASNDNTLWMDLGVTTNSNTTEGGTWDLVIGSSDWYKYYRIVCTPRTTTSLMVDRLKISAQELKAVEVTANDEYDYIEFNPLTIKQVYKTDKAKYYKYDGGEELVGNVVGDNVYFVYFDSLSGFGNGRYFTFDIGTTELSDLVELYLNFTLGYDWSDTASKSTGILGGDAFPLIQIYNQKVNLGGTSALGSHTYNTYEDVKWKIKIQNGVGEIYRLNDNNEYELDYTFNYSTPISGTVRIGWNSSTRYMVSGKVYYDGTYVNVNGERRWTITKPVNYNKRSFTFPELSSEGSIGGNEYGVVADGNIAGLMNLFHPLVDGKVQADMCAEFSTSSDGIIFYSPIPFCPREFDAYHYLASDGSYIRELGTVNTLSLTYSDDGVNWGSRRQFVRVTNTTEITYLEDSSFDKNIFHKYWRFSIDNVSTPIRIGKLVISGYSAEPLTADNCDYKELIPQLVYEHNPTVFEQSTAGTYTFNVTEEAPYEITLVGGGGGGAFNSSGNAGSAAAGNSGSGLVVNANLKAGTYVLTVGAGGAKSGWLDANTWGGNGAESKITKDGVVIATAGGGTGNHCWWRSGSERNSTVGAAPTYTDALGVTDVILNTQGNWGGLAATSSGGASVISGTTWGKGGDTRNRNAADNGNAGCIRIVRLEK